ncbi:pentatricopeptide repeat-containing protein At1g19720 isoform X1 [Amborella trichopoda]|nr:pentatricopeptide repeat-containing protein At1g19720 isoform X1 [Amborella trichopoda]|eukprot:XP_020532202.1 pentatricopeptide repeat-containing protein At1g19720 isoform X1 [Amborella trichopoda]
MEILPLPFKSHTIRDLQLNQLCSQGKLKEAIKALNSIPQHALDPSPSTYISLLQACIDANSVSQGRDIHAHIPLSLKTNLSLQTKLVSMYAKCGSLDVARQVFDEIGDKNSIFLWSAMIAGYAREGIWEEVLMLSVSMQQQGVTPDWFLFPKILQAINNLGLLDKGKETHSSAIRKGHILSVHVANSLVAMYVKCGELSYARKLFDGMTQKDLVSWNSIISGHFKNGNTEEAINLFKQMQVEGIKPGVVTFNIMISSYNQMGNCDLAFDLMEKMQFSGIIPDVVTWTSMISGLSQNERENQALHLFREMRFEGIKPNGVTVASALNACSNLRYINWGVEIHSMAVKGGFAEELLVGNALIDMYWKCSDLEAAKRVFDKLTRRDVFTYNSMIGGYAQSGYCGKAHDLFMEMQSSSVKRNTVTYNTMISGHLKNGDEDQALQLFQRMELEGVLRNTASWNALISGFLLNGHWEEALGVFRKMQATQIRPNSVTVLSVLPACAILMAAKKLREIHCFVIKHHLKAEISIVNALIDTYAKLGDITFAQTLFDSMLTKDIISYNSIISGLVMNGKGRNAIDIFEQMKLLRIAPNQRTILSVINAFGLEKMVPEGEKLFSTMAEEFQLFPTIEHCSAMVGLLGRARLLREAMDFIDNMPLEPDASIWSAFLSACRCNGNIRLATHAIKKLLELEPEDPLINRILSQIYDGSRSRNHVKNQAMVKAFGHTWIEVKNLVHEFVAGMVSLPSSDSLSIKLKSLAEIYKSKGRKLPDAGFLQLEEEEKEEIIGTHCVKLAITFGIINIHAPQSIRVVKNIRVCQECHDFAKFVSRNCSQEILLKDPKTLHCFKNGQCSCKDYW